MRGFWECASNISRVSYCDAWHLCCPCVIHQAVPFQRNLHGRQQSFFLLSFHFGGGMKAGDVPAVHATRWVGHVMHSVDKPVAIPMYALFRVSFEIGVLSLQPLK